MNAGHHVEWMKELCRIMEGRGMTVIGLVLLLHYANMPTPTTTASVFALCHSAVNASGE
jgi:hypothetical protein